MTREAYIPPDNVATGGPGEVMGRSQFGLDPADFSSAFSSGPLDDKLKMRKSPASGGRPGLFGGLVVKTVKL